MSTTSLNSCKNLARELSMLLQPIYDIPIDFNRVSGMLFGHNMGDALGAPQEFVHLEGDGHLQHQFRIPSQYHDDKVFPVGTITDDSAMTLILANFLISNRSYSDREILSRYMNWAMNWKRGLGRNTTRLLKYKRTQTYYRKFAEFFPVDHNGQLGENVCKSNGSLMRCSPLAVINNLEVFVQDCYLTNPHPVNLQVNILYGIVLQMAIRGYSPSMIREVIQACVETDQERWHPDLFSTYQSAVNDAKVKKINRRMAEERGYVLHPFYLVIFFLHGTHTYLETMRSLAYRYRDDTDTNCAIVGAMLGAVEGFSAMMSDSCLLQNHNIMVNLSSNLEGINQEKFHPLYVLSYPELGRQLVQATSQ